MDETFTFSSASDGNAETASFDGGAGNDTLDATFGAVGFATAGLATSFTDNGDGTFSATYSRGNAAVEGDDSVSIVNIENVFISVFGDSNGVGNEDFVRTGGGGDTIFTDNGNDHIDAGRGIDTVDGGGGDEFSNSDTISKDFSDLSVDILWNIRTGAFTGPGTFTDLEAFGVLRTGSGNDVIVTSNFGNGSGLPGDETVHTGAGNDHVTVSNGVDHVTMGDGDDRLVLDYLDAAFPGSVNSILTQNPDGSYSGEHRGVFSSGLRTGVTFDGVEHFTIILPTSGGNGSNLNDTIHTGDGNDVIYSGASSDLIHAGRGVDQVDGGETGTDVDGLAKEFDAAGPAVNVNLDANTYSGPGLIRNIEWFIDLKTSDGNDVVVTSSARDSNGGGNDRIETRSGDDVIILFDGNDIVDLGAGSDRLIIDYATYNPFTGGTTMTLNQTSGGTYSGLLDTNRSERDVTFAGVEHFTIHTTVSGGNGFNLQDNIVTGDGDDIVATHASADRIEVGAGIDSVDGGSAIDGLAKEFGADGPAININLDANTYSGPGSFTNLEYFIDLRTGDGNDVVVTSSVNATSSGGGDDTISTRGGNDLVTLFTGNDNVDLGGGNDRLIIDYATYNYFAHGTTMTLTETSPGIYSGFLDGGTSNVDVTFAGVEHFTFLGNSTGGNGFNSKDNIVTGAGNDIIFTYHSADTVDAGAGDDIIDGGSYFDTIDGGAGDDIIDGGTHNDTIRAGAGDDMLDGGAGADTLKGQGGDDTYIVDDAGDQVVEWAGRGIDTIQSAIDLRLGGHLENLTLDGAAIVGTGNGLRNVIRGNAAANQLDGRKGADTLIGGNGGDRLDGGTGADVMKGQRGNDTYIVDDSSDKIAEWSGQGVDGVETALDYRLGWQIEKLVLTGGDAVNGTGNGSDNNIRGNAAANRLDGLGGSDVLLAGAGNDTLDGGAGPDTMKGQAGNDRYIVDDAGDTIVEWSGRGLDTVDAAGDHRLGWEVENLTLTGGRSINGVGNGSDNVMTGNAARNRLNGLDGDDILNGGAGADIVRGGTGDDLLMGGDGTDRIRGGAGADRFHFNDGDSGSAHRNADRVLDFTRGDDRINLARIDADSSTGADDRFSFIGTDAFSGAAGELRFDVIGGDAFVQADTNGDGTADFSLWVENMAVVQPGDFYL